jgi:hypothetical protein
VTAVDGTAGAKLDYRPTFQYASKDTRPVSVESISAMSSSAFTAFCVAAADRLEVAGTRLQHTTDVVQHLHAATVRLYCYRNTHHLSTRTQSQQQWHAVAQGTSLAGPGSTPGAGEALCTAPPHGRDFESDRAWYRTHRRTLAHELLNHTGRDRYTCREGSALNSGWCRSKSSSVSSPPSPSPSAALNNTSPSLCGARCLGWGAFKGGQCGSAVWSGSVLCTELGKGT